MLHNYEDCSEQECKVDRYRDTGNVFSEKYFNKHGKLHRDGDLPALIMYTQEATVYYKEYKQNGKLHREGGKPATISYDQNGKITVEEYFIDDIEVTKKECNEFKRFKKQYQDDITTISLNLKHKNLIIRNYCRKYLLTSS